MFNIVKKTFAYGAHQVTLETGEIARQAGGAVAVSMDEARKPMGLPKRQHIQAMLADPGIAGRWQAAQGAPDAAAFPLATLPPRHTG